MSQIRYTLIRIPKQGLQCTDHQLRNFFVLGRIVRISFSGGKISKICPSKKKCHCKNARSLFHMVEPNHQLEDCLSESMCIIDNCNQRHNTLLRIEKSTPKSISVNFWDKKQAKMNEEAEVCTTRANYSAIVQVVPVIVASFSQKQTVSGLLVSGSTSSFVSHQLAKTLALKPMETSDVTIRGFKSQKNHFTNTVQFPIAWAVVNDSQLFNC